MTPYSPWQSPPNTGTLEMGDLASFEINETEDPSEAESGETDHKDAMKSALEAITQQSQVIDKLLDMLSAKRGN